jgi:Domain of unknown function (DUF5666)
MIRKTVLAVGIGAVVVLGAAGTAVAAQSDSTQATPTPSTTAAATPTPAPSAGRGGHQRVNLNFPGEYAQWTTFDAKTNTSTVYNGIRGQVGAVSASSISVKASNGTSQTFAVDANTRVRGTGKSDGIGQVKVGDQVVVVGTGQGSFTAVQVNDRPHGGKHR